MRASNLFARVLHVFAYSLFFSVIILNSADADPSAVALLRGAEVARTKYDSMRVRLKITYIEPPPRVEVMALIELKGDALRFEVLQGEVPGQIILRKDNEFYSYRRVPNEDVQLYDLDYAVGVKGDLAFDPRLLGLSSLMDCAATISKSLWYDNVDDLAILRHEPINDHNAWVVRATRRDRVSDYWIEEPGFRVHKRTVVGPIVNEQLSYDSEVLSSWEPDARNFVFPSKVVCVQRHSPYKVIYEILEVEENAQIASDRFTLGSMDLPVNTAIVDYRVKRRVGYWNGENITQSLVYSGERPVLPIAPQSNWPRKMILLALNLVIVFILLYYLIRKRKIGTPSES